MGKTEIQAYEEGHFVESESTQHNFDPAGKPLIHAHLV